MNTKQFLKGFVTVDKEAGTFSMIASTADVDRQGESIDQAGWDLTNYKQNPIILWAHDYSALPIGVAEEIEVTDNGLVITRGRFASEEANPQAKNVQMLYDEGILRTMSVGFIPLERNGNIITKAELLEVSFVPVPANPFALSLAMQKGLKVEPALVELISKSVEPEPVVVPEGDTATTVPKEGEEEAVVETPPVVEETPTAVTEEKSGRVLSTKNRDLISSSIQSMKTSIVQLEELLTATEPAPKVQNNMDTSVATDDHVERSESKGSLIVIPEETLKELLTNTREARVKNELSQAVMKRLLK